MSGCAVVHRPPATTASITAYADTARVAERATVDTVVARLARRAAARGDRTLDVLLLSGGGQHGAYGVGFLRGWRERADAPMPAFDLVAGVSTGALQAPFALLGTEAALDTLAAVYRRAADEIAPRVDWLFWLRRTGGVVNAERFERTIERLVDARLRDQLGAAFGAERQLVIATTDFDLAVGRTWDMRRELGTTAQGLVRARTLLRATTAVPGIFPPVVLDGHVQADGGVVSNVASVLDLEDYRALARRLRAAGAASVTEPVTVRVWAVMNVWTHPAIKVTKPASRRGIQQRSNALLFWAQQPQIVTRHAELARAVSADVPGLRMEFRYTAVPSALSTAPGADKLFDAAWMRRLEALGYARAQSAAPWDATPSAYERPATAPGGGAAAGAAPNDSPGATPNDSLPVLGGWRVSAHRAPGVSATTPPEAARWVGREAHYARAAARFGAVSSARVTLGERLLFTTTTSAPALTRGHVHEVALLLHPLPRP